VQKWQPSKDGISKPFAWGYGKTVMVLGEPNADLLEHNADLGMIMNTIDVMFKTKGIEYVFNTLYPERLLFIMERYSVASRVEQGSNVYFSTTIEQESHMYRYNIMIRLMVGKRALLCNHHQFIAQLPLDGIDAIISGNKITKVEFVN